MTENTRNGSRTYQWAITTLIALLCFSAGLIIQGERQSSRITTNTVEIRVLKEGLGKIETKLDRVLEERYGGF